MPHITFCSTPSSPFMQLAESRRLEKLAYEAALSILIPLTFVDSLFPLCTAIDETDLIYPSTLKVVTGLFLCYYPFYRRVIAADTEQLMLSEVLLETSPNDKALHYLEYLTAEKGVSAFVNRILPEKQKEVLNRMVSPANCPEQKKPLWKYCDLNRPGNLELLLQAGAL